MPLLSLANVTSVVVSLVLPIAKAAPGRLERFLINSASYLPASLFGVIIKIMGSSRSRSRMVEITPFFTPIRERMGTSMLASARTAQKDRDFS